MAVPHAHPAKARSAKSDDVIPQRYSRAEITPAKQEQLRKLVAGELTDPQVIDADGVWIADRSEHGLQRATRVGKAGEPMADQALAWARQRLD